MRVFVGLIMLAVCTVSLIIIGQQGFEQVLALASHWLQDFPNGTPTLEENDNYGTTLLIVQ
jgi:hypothetical protein